MQARSRRVKRQRTQCGSFGGQIESYGFKNIFMSVLDIFLTNISGEHRAQRKEEIYADFEREVEDQLAVDALKYTSENAATFPRLEMLAILQRFFKSKGFQIQVCFCPKDSTQSKKSLIAQGEIPQQ